MKNMLLYGITCCLLLIAAAGCLPASIYVEPGTVIETKSYTIEAPPGTWQYKIVDENDGVHFYYEGWKKIGISDIYFAEGNPAQIIIARIPIGDEDAGLAKESVFRNYYRRVEESNENQYRRSGYFKTELLQINTFYFNGREYFRVDYKLTDCPMPDNTVIKEGYGKLLFYFPEEYLTDRAFYLFQREEYIWENAAAKDSLADISAGRYTALENDITMVLRTMKLK